MSTSKVLVPTDFTPAASNALLNACAIAQNTGGSILLLHIKNSHSKKLLDKVGVTLEGLETYLDEICKLASMEMKVACNYMVVEGDIHSDINRVAADVEVNMMVIGSHGKVGLRQNVFGSDLLKIVSKTQKPVYVVSEKSSAIPSFEKIIFPYGSHERFQNKIEATVLIATAFQSEVLIYSMNRNGDGPSKESLANIEKARRAFEAVGVKHIMVHDEPDTYSIGFARQTLKYADRVGAKTIAIMSVPSAVHGFISNSDKEIFIENELGVNFLMTSDY